LKTLFTIQNQPNINQELESLQKPLIEEKTLNQIKQEPIINNQSSFGLSNALSLQKMQDTPNIPKQAYPINHIIEKIIELQNLRPPVIKTIQIQLNPPSLGHIDVKVSIDSSKNLSASIHVDNQEVFNLVNSNLDTLKTTILQQGINVSQISVTSSNLSQQNFNQNQNQQNQTFSSFNQNFNQSGNSQNSFNQAFSQQKQQNYVFENNTKQIKRIFRKTIALLDISI
ncbi:MAG: flagellar hook-length control protein FliK, partial [Desulfurella sp.]